MNALVEAFDQITADLMGELEALYKDLRHHPKLSMQEVRTAKIAADTLQGSATK